MQFCRIIALLLLACLLQCYPSLGQEIWFSPRSAPAYAKEFYGLFEKGAPWNDTASRLRTFEISVQLQMNASDDQLKKVITGLRARRIALGLGMLPLTGQGPDGCGYHVEGYAASLENLALAKRIKALGGDVAFYDMDEPLYYGHLFNGKSACKSSVENLVVDVAEKVAQVRSQFPEAEIGETEPVPIDLAVLERWLDAIHLATGRPLSFFRADVQWSTHWGPQVIELAKLLKRKGIPLQVIYNGAGKDRSDAEWTSHALANAQAFEAIVAPDAVAFVSWTEYPKRFLPETDPTTMTGIISQYLLWRKNRTQSAK